MCIGVVHEKKFLATDVVYERRVMWEISQFSTCASEKRHANKQTVLITYCFLFFVLQSSCILMDSSF